MRSYASRRRGAALLYVLAAVGATAVLVVANLQLATTARRKVDRVEDDARTEYSRYAAGQVFSARAAAHDGLADNPISLNLAGVPVSATVALSTGRLASIGVTENSRTGSLTAIDPRGYTPFLYALYVDHDANLPGPSTKLSLIGSSSGTTAAAFFGHNMTGGAGGIDIEGPLDTTLTTIPAAFTGSYGPIKSGLSADNLTALPIILLANETYLLPTTISGRGANGGGVSTITATADLTVTGTFNANYVIVTSGKMHLKPPISVASGCHLVLMSNGDVDVANDGTLSAFVYCRGKFTTTNHVVVINGAVCTNDFEDQKQLTINYDDFFWSDPSTLDTFYVPSVNAPD